MVEGQRNSGERRPGPTMEGSEPTQRVQAITSSSTPSMASSSSPSMASSSTSTSSSPHRKLLHSLIYWAVQRCRMSESPCRLTVSVKRPPDPAGSSPLRISVSDTGVGSKLEEFLELDALARETPVEKWDGTLIITTTGINDKAIYRYQFNLQEDISSSARFTKLATTYKNHAIFSGTEVCLCLSNEADVDDFILWLVSFVRKIFVLRAANLACELVEQEGSAESRNVCLSQDSDDVHLSITTSSIERLVSGLKDYVLSHGNTCDKCDACYMNRDLLKIGTGAANDVDRRKTKGLHVEVVIMIAQTSSDLSCWMVNCSSTQVLHFEDFIPCPVSQSSFNVLMSIDWQSYGIKLKGGFMDDDGNAVLQWDDMTFARVDIAIHTYHRGYPVSILYILLSQKQTVDCRNFMIYSKRNRRGSPSISKEKAYFISLDCLPVWEGISLLDFHKCFSLVILDLL